MQNKLQKPKKKKRKFSIQFLKRQRKQGLKQGIQKIMKLQSFVPGTIQGQSIIPQQGQIIGQFNGFSQNQQGAIYSASNNGTVIQSSQNQTGQQQFVPKKLNDQIGKGYSSKVFKGKDERTEQEVAVKVIDMKMMSNEVQLFLLQNEISVMKKLALTGNINILKLSDVFQTANNTYIITEMCNQGDLKDFLKKYTALEESQAHKILKHIISGYRELAKHRIVHRDIKPANILINDGIPKLADFGFAKDIDAPPYKYYYNVGTPMYMCPQSLQKNEYSIKSDIWSIGVLYFELLYGVTPWTAETEKELHHKVCNVTVSFPNTKNITNESKDFIRGCLQVDERKRLSLEQIDNHPIMKLNFKKDKQKHEGSLKNLHSQQQQQQQVPSQMKRPSSQQQLASLGNQTTQVGQNSQQELGKENSPPSKDNIGSNNTLQPQRKGNKTDYRRGENDQSHNTASASGQVTNISVLPTTTVVQNPNTSTQGNGAVNTPINSIGNTNTDFKNMLKSEQRKVANFQHPQSYLIQDEAKNEQQPNDSNKGHHQSAKTQQQQQLNEIEENKNPTSMQVSEKINGTTPTAVNSNSTNSNTTTANTSNGLNEFQSNDRIILAQINYCRFLFRLSKLAEDSSILESPMMKEKLIFLILKNVMVKITKLNSLNDISQNTFNLTDWPTYSKTESFKRFQQVISEYHAKYLNHFIQRWEKGIFSQAATKVELQKDKKFDAIFDDNFLEFESYYIILQSFLRFTIREINHIVKNKVKTEQETLSTNVEQSIVLLDYLITYFQLTTLILDHYQNHLNFADYSKIEQIAEGKPVQLKKIHFAQIRSKIYTLEI